MECLIQRGLQSNLVGLRHDILRNLLPQLRPARDSTTQSRDERPRIVRRPWHERPERQARAAQALWSARNERRWPASRRRYGQARTRTRPFRATEKRGLAGAEQMPHRLARRVERGLASRRRIEPGAMDAGEIALSVRDLREQCGPSLRGRLIRLGRTGWHVLVAFSLGSRWLGPPIPGDY